MTCTFSRVRQRLLLLVVALAPAVMAAPPPRALAPPTAETILRRAELARNPFLGVGVNVDLQVVSRDSGKELRRSSYMLITHRFDRSLLVMRQPDPAKPGALLIRDDTFWMLLPEAEKPVRLALGHVVAGDLSHPGFLRVNLRIRYEPCRISEDIADGVPCWELELAPKEQAEIFGRVRYWATKANTLPARIEYYAPTGELLKTARFLSFRSTGLGLAPERIEIEDALRPQELAVLTLGPPTRVDTFMLDFDVHDLLLLRDAARRLGATGPLEVEPLVDALRSAISDEEGAAAP